MNAPTEVISPRGGSTFVKKLLDDAAATGSGDEADILGAEKAAVQITGITSATVDFEGTIDGTNWVQVKDVDAAVDTTGNGIFFFTRIAGLRGFRLNVTAYTSGTIVGYGSFWS